MTDLFLAEDLPRSLYRLSESALPIELDEEREVCEEALLADPDLEPRDLERETEVPERDPDREEELEEPERDLEPERE